MEGCPKTLMISYDTKEAGSADFTEALSSYIREYYQENPENYTAEISQLNQLRKSVVTVSRGNQGCSLLRKYFTQLFYLQSRFPMGEGGAASVLLTWYDVYSGEPVSVKDILYEQACVLFNLGGLYSQLGANEMRATEESMKIACTYFQCAAGAFRHLWENFSLESMSDMNKEIVKLKEIVMLGQAQECLLEKSIKDNKKNVLIARIGIQVKEYFEEAVKLLAGSETSEMGSSVRKSWTKHLQIKILVYTAIAYMYMSNESHDGERFGEAVGYLKIASEKMTEALKLSKGQPDQVLETTTFIMDVVGNKLQGAVKDNDFVYHQSVPAADKLPEIKGAPLVKAMPFTYNDPTVTDIFQRLIPMRAHESASLYSEEKAKLLRKMATEVEDKNSTLNEVLAAMHIEELLNPEEEKLPDNLVSKLKTVQSEGGGLVRVDETIKELSEFSSKLKFLMDEIKEQLEEAREEIKGEEEDSKRNEELEKHLKDLCQCREAHEKANKTNSEIMKHFETHRPILEFLRGPQEDILASLPSQNVIDAPQDEPVVQRIRELLGAVEKMKTQRAQLMAQLREQLNKDDITKELVVRQNGGTEVFFEEQLQKHNEQCAVLRQNMAAQENILASLTEANAKYAPTRQAAQDVTLQRNAKVQSYMASLTLYDEMLERMRQGLQFYKSLELTLAKLAKRIDNFLGDRTKEKTKKVPPPEPAAKGRNVPPARPTAAKPLFMMEKPGPKANQAPVNSTGSADDLPSFGSNSASVSWNESRSREPPSSGNWQSDLPPRSMSQPSSAVRDSSGPGSMMYGTAGNRGALYGSPPTSIGSREEPISRMPGSGHVPQDHQSQTTPTQTLFKDSSYPPTVSHPGLSWQGPPSSGLPHQGTRMQGMRPGLPQPGLPQDSLQNFMLQNQRTGQQQNVPHQGLSQRGLPPHGFPQQGLPQQGITQPRFSHQGFPQQGMSQQVIPQHGVSRQGMSQQGMPQQGIPPQGIPQRGQTQQGMPQQGIPPQGIPQRGQTQQGMPQQGMPQQGLSQLQTEMVPQGMNQHGVGQQAVSQNRLPYHGLPQQVVPPQGTQQSGMNWQGMNQTAHPRQGTPQQGPFYPIVCQQGIPVVGSQQQVVHQQGVLPIATGQPIVLPQGMQDKGFLRQEPRSLAPVLDPNHPGLSSTNLSRMESSPLSPQQSLVSQQYAAHNLAHQGKPRYDVPGGPAMISPQLGQQQLPFRPALPGEGQVSLGPNFAREGGIPPTQVDRKPFQSATYRSGSVQEGTSHLGRQLSTDRGIAMEGFTSQNSQGKIQEGFTANQRQTQQDPLSPPSHYHASVRNLGPFQQGYRQQGFDQQLPSFQGPSQHGNNPPMQEPASSFPASSQTFRQQRGSPGLGPQVSLQRLAEGSSGQNLGLQDLPSHGMGNQGQQPLRLPEPLQPINGSGMLYSSSIQSGSNQRRSSDPVSVQETPYIPPSDFRQDSPQFNTQFRGLQRNSSAQVGVAGTARTSNWQFNDPKSSSGVERASPIVHGSTIESMSPRLQEPIQSSLMRQFSGNNSQAQQPQYASHQLPSNSSDASSCPDMRGAGSTAHYDGWQRPKNPTDSRPEVIARGEEVATQYFPGSPTKTYQDQYGQQRARDLSIGTSGELPDRPEIRRLGVSTDQISPLSRDLSGGGSEPSLQPPLLPVSHAAISYQERGGRHMMSVIPSPQGEGPRPSNSKAFEATLEDPRQVASQKRPVDYPQHAVREDSLSSTLNHQFRPPSPGHELGKQQRLRGQPSDPGLSFSTGQHDLHLPLEFSPPIAGRGAQPSAPLGPGPPPDVPSTSYYAVHLQAAGPRFQNQFSQLSNSLQNPITLSTGPLMSATLDPVVSAILRQNRQVNVTLASSTSTSSSPSMDLSQYNFQQFQFQQVLLQQQQLIALLQTQQSQHTQQINIETHQIEKLQAQIEDQQKLIQRLVASQHYPSESERSVTTASNSNELRNDTHSDYGENGAQVDHNYSSQGACLGDACKLESKRDQSSVISTSTVNDTGEPKRVIVQAEKGAASSATKLAQSSCKSKARANSKALEAEILADFEALDLIVGETPEGPALLVDEQKVAESEGCNVTSKTSTTSSGIDASATSAAATTTSAAATSVLPDVPFYEPMLDEEHNNRLRHSAAQIEGQSASDLTENRETRDATNDEGLDRRMQSREMAKGETRNPSGGKVETEDKEVYTTASIEKVERKEQTKGGVKEGETEKSDDKKLCAERDSELDMADKPEDTIIVSDGRERSDILPDPMSVSVMRSKGALPPPFSRQLGRESFIILDDKNEAWVKYLKKLDQGVESLHSTCMELCRKVPGTTVDGFAQMWNDLGQVEDLDSCSYTCEAGTININKNRYRDILPWDHSRVKLESLENDYINASHIENLTPFSPSYIATQGPIPQCFEDFWTMIWEQQCTVIAMLTSEVEGSKLKCHPYWPKEIDTTVNYGNMAVCITNQEFHPQWKNRIMLLTDLKSNETRIVRHLQFTAWPDYGVPATPYDILAFVEEVYRASRKCDANMKNVIVTHCSAGVGRTGTFCCIYSAIAEINGGNGLIDIPGVVRKLRQCRSHMVQRKEQLVFCYQAILCYAQQFLAGEQLKREREVPNDGGDDDAFGKTPSNLSELEDSCDSFLTRGTEDDNSTNKQEECKSHQEQEKPDIQDEEGAKLTVSTSESSLSLNSTVEERTLDVSTVSTVKGKSRFQNQQESLLSLDIIDFNDRPLTTNTSECAVGDQSFLSDIVLIDVTGEQPMESQKTDSKNENGEESKDGAEYSEEPNIEQGELKTSQRQLNGHNLSISVEKIPLAVDNVVDVQDISPTELEKAETHHKFKISSGIFSTTKSPPLSPTQSIRNERSCGTPQESDDKTESANFEEDLSQE